CKQECGYGPVPEQAAIDHRFLRRIVGEIEHRHLVAHSIARRVAADAVLEFHSRVGLSPESPNPRRAKTAIVAGACSTVQTDHLALGAQADGLEAGDLYALIDADSEENDREDADDRCSLPALPRLRQRRLLHVRPRDKLLDRLDAGEINAGVFTETMLL